MPAPIRSRARRSAAKLPGSSCRCGLLKLPPNGEERQKRPPSSSSTGTRLHNDRRCSCAASTAPKEGAGAQPGRQQHSGRCTLLAKQHHSGHGSAGVRRHTLIVVLDFPTLTLTRQIGLQTSVDSLVAACWHSARLDTCREKVAVLLGFSSALKLHHGPQAIAFVARTSGQRRA